MKIIYHCFGGSHSSVTAAAIHAGLLQTSRLPTAQELIDLPYYDQQTSQDHGQLRYIGRDEFGNEIYIAGKRNLSNIFTRIMGDVAKVFGIDSNEILLINTMPYVNWLMVIGGFSSRRMKWIKFGRPIVIKGTQFSFFKFVSLVDTVKYKYTSQVHKDGRRQQVDQDKKAVLFLCETGWFGSLVAGLLYLGRLPDKPCQTDLTIVQEFYQEHRDNLGKVIYLGRDIYGQEVYTLGVLNEPQLVPVALRNLIQLYDIPQENLKLVNTLGRTSLKLTAGIKLINFKLDALGWPLVKSGLLDLYPYYSELVKEFRQRLITETN